MILSTGDSAIVEYESGEGKRKTEGVKIVHCKKGEEEKYIQKMDRNLKKAVVIKIKRNEKTAIKTTLQKINYRL